MFVLVEYLIRCFLEAMAPKKRPSSKKASPQKKAKAAKQKKGQEEEELETSQHPTTPIPSSSDEEAFNEACARQQQQIMDQNEVNDESSAKEGDASEEKDEGSAKEADASEDKPSTPLKAKSKAKAKAKAKGETKAKAKAKGSGKPSKNSTQEKQGNGKDDPPTKEKPKTLRMQVNSWNEALGEEKKDEGSDGEVEIAMNETRDRQKAQKLAKMEKAGTVPSSVKDALEAASKSENPRAAKTMLINRLFKKENGNFILQPNDPSFKRVLKHLDEKFGKEQNTSFLDSI